MYQRILLFKILADPIISFIKNKTEIVCSLLIRDPETQTPPKKLEIYFGLSGLFRQIFKDNYLVLID